MSSASVTEVDLNAYVDGETAPDRRALIDAYLAAQPSEAARVENWRRQNDLIRAAMGRFGHDGPARPQTGGFTQLRIEPSRPVAPAAPATVLGLPIRVTEVATFRPRKLAIAIGGAFLAGAASTVIAVMLFGLTPNFLSGLRTLTGRPVETAVITDFGPALAARAIEAHVTYSGEPAEPNLVPAALSETLSARLGLSVPVPDLTSFGLKLLGGRLAPADIGPAAFLTYEGAQGEHIGFLVTRAPGEDNLRIAQGRGASVALWTAGGMGYAVTGSGDRQRLLAIGDSIRKRITSP